MITTLIATVTLAQQATIKPAPVGLTAYHGNLLLTIGEKNSNMEFQASRSVSRASGTIAWTESKMIVDGAKQTSPDIRPFSYSVDDMGSVANFSGGNAKLLAPSIVLLTHLFQPREPLPVDGSAEFVVTKGVDYPEYKVTVKRVADEQMDGASVQVFQQTEKSVDDDSLDANGMFWVQPDGTLVKLNQGITRLRLGTGESASGSLSISRMKP